MARTLNKEEARQYALDLAGRMEYYCYWAVENENKPGAYSVREPKGFAQLHEDITLVNDKGETKEVKAGSWLLISDPDNVYQYYHPSDESFRKRWSKTNEYGKFL